MIAKIVDGKILTPPQNDGNMMNVNKNPAWLEANGFAEIEIPEPEIVVIPKRYSKIKIMEELGTDWPAVKTMIENAGMWDWFSQSNNLKDGNAYFEAFKENLTSEQLAKLDNCIYNPED